MSETCQKLAFTHPIVVLKGGLKNNWMKKLDRVNRPLKSRLKKSKLRIIKEPITINHNQEKITRRVNVL